MANRPPTRGIEQQIGFIAGACLPKPIEGTNPEEAKGIHRQVEELLKKGYVREIWNPCAIPTLLVPGECT